MKMLWRMLVLWSVIIACNLVLFTDAKASVTENKKILILNSYHSGYKGSDDILNGFRESLLKSLPKTELHVEYLDSKNFSGAEFDRKVAELLQFKYQHHHFDLILSTDDYAFDIIERHREDVFRDTPVVFCGTNSFDRSRLTGKRGVIGVDERPSFADTLDLIYKIHPATTDIVVIHDSSITGQLNSGEFRQAAARYEGRTKTTYLAGLKMNNLLDQVKRLQPGSVIMYFASFVEAGDGERISSGDALQALADVSRVPIYGGWEFSLGRGIVGGRLIDLRKHGVLSAGLAVRILNGENPAALPLLSPSPNRYMFDYARMTRFGITEKQLPPDSAIINKPPGFFWENRVEILALLAGTLFVALLTIFVMLVKSRRNLQVHRDELAQRNDELEEALSNVRQLEGIIPICMYCKNIWDDKESWQHLETYISKHSDAKFSHGVCPDCLATAKRDMGLLE